MRALETVLGSDPAGALQALAREIGSPTSLAQIGMPEAGLEAAAENALANSYWNPRALERGAIRDLLQRAFDGDAPSTDWRKPS
jgi:alcohol dehydrogenase class IV